jgi:hypothetical protein
VISGMCVTARFCRPLGFALILAVSIGCGRPLGRPAGVPLEAIEVGFSKNGGWVHCWVDEAAQVNCCRIYNGGGALLSRFGHDDDPDDVFVPYGGSRIVPESELRQLDLLRTTPEQIWLANGDVLLPRNDFETQKRSVDNLMRTRREGPWRELRRTPQGLGGLEKWPGRGP